MIQKQTGLKPWETLPSLVEVRSRVGRLQQNMQSAGLDCIWVMQPAQLYYLARTAQQGLVVVPAEGEPAVFIRKSLSRAAEESCFPVRPLPPFRQWPALMAEIGTNLRRVGLELDVLPAADYLRLQREFSGTAFIDASPELRRVRMIKNDYEIDCQREAGRRLAIGLKRLAEVMEPGQDERNLTAELERALRLAGDPGVVRVRNWRAEVANGVVAVGPSAAYPTAFDGPVGYPGNHPALPAGPAHRILEEGQPVLVDIVASAAGYIVDVTRLFFCGELPEHFRRAHAFIQELLGWVEAQLVPGAIPGEIYKNCLTRVRQAGYIDNFMNRGDAQVSFIGHGIGLELDEWPVLTEKWVEPLATGMVVAVEPKIIFPDGGVGLENTYVIRPGPPEKLTLFEENPIH